MYALWDPGLSTPEGRASLAAVLAPVAVERLVVEVDDEHVAEAQLRLSTYADPVHAVVRTE